MTLDVSGYDHSCVGRGLFESKEDLFRDMRSMIASIARPEGVLKKLERTKSIEMMVKLGELKKLDNMPSTRPAKVRPVTAGLASTRSATMRSLNNIKKTKRGVTVIVDEESTKQPPKGKIYGRKFNGRFASKATYTKYHDQRFKNASSLHMSVTQKKKVMVECGCTWKRVDMVWASKALEALRLPLALPDDSPQRHKLEQFSDVEPEGRHEVQYEYDSSSDPSPAFPATVADFTCGKDYCRLGCICQSISGTQKKLLRKDHCSQHQCMFSCHCQHLTRSRATLFENLSPIMDSKFSFNNLDKSTILMKKKLFVPETMSKEDSGDEIRRKEFEKKLLEVSNSSAKESLSPDSPNKIDGQGAVRKSGRLKDKSLYNSLVMMESEGIANSTTEEKGKKCLKRKNKVLCSKSRTLRVSEELGSNLKSVPVEECLEISSDSEDDVPIKKRKVGCDSHGSDSPKKSKFDTLPLVPKKDFTMEHILIKKGSAVNGNQHSLLLESFYNFDWQPYKLELSNLFYEKVFTDNGIDRKRKELLWKNIKIQMHPGDKDSIPKPVKEKLKNQSFEYVRAMMTMVSKTAAVVGSVVKDLDSDEANEGQVDDNNHKVVCTLPVTKSSNPPGDDSVIVVEDEAEDSVNKPSSPSIITKVCSLAKSSSDPKSPISPLLPVPFSNATGISGCCQFQFNALQSTSTTRTIPSSENRGLSLKNQNLLRSTPLLNISDTPQLTTKVVPPIPAEIAKLQAQLNLKQSLNKAVNSTQKIVISPKHSFPGPNNIPESVPALESTSASTPIASSVIKLIMMPNAQPIVPLAVTRAAYLPQVTIQVTPSTLEAKMNQIIMPQTVKPHQGENDRKKIIVLKHVPTITQAKIYPQGHLIQKSLNLQKNAISLIPQNLTPLAQNVLRQKLSSIPPVPQSSKSFTLPKTELIVSPKIIKTSNASGTIEIGDSDDDDERKAIKQQTNGSVVREEANLTDCLNCVKDKDFNLSVNGCLSLKDANENGDSKSISSRSDAGNDEQSLCRKRLKMLYQEIVRIESMEEKRDKVSAREILEKAIEMVERLQNDSVTLANEQLSEHKKRRKLAQRLEELKNLKEVEFAK